MLRVFSIKRVFEKQIQRRRVKMAKELDVSRANLYMCDPENLVIIEDENDPLYDVRVKLPVEENMVMNIIAKGILQNVRCVRRGDARVVVIGRQRVKAAREANKRLKKEGSELLKVPVIMVVGDEAIQYGVMISENELRRDDSPIAKAEKCQKYLAMGRTVADAAVTFGVTVQTVNNWIEIVGLSAAVKKAVDQGMISATAAAKLSALSPTEQKDAVTEMVAAAVASGKKKVTVGKAAAKSGKKPAMKGKKEIKEMLELIEEPWVVATLKWILGESKNIEI